jgi:tetratricopeptide (TPR) repeat protein
VERPSDRLIGPGDPFPLAAPVPKEAYTREEVRHLLGISERQIRSWEKQSFVTALEAYKFSDLLALRTLLGLRKNKIPVSKIRRALDALRERLRDVQDPLSELKIYSEGKNIRVQFRGTKMESVSGQLLLNFDRAEIEKLLSFPQKNGADEKSETQKKRRDAERWFEKGLELEQLGAPLADIVAAYEQALTLDPASTGALVNLGTVYFNARAWRDAERYYRQALEVDPNYALAHFNLGNLFDEKGDRENALEHYLAALKAHANYADAHYNIALVYQSLGHTMKAVHHWQAYLKIDPGSSWAAIARRELSKLRDSAIVRGSRK